MLRIKTTRGKKCYIGKKVVDKKTVYRGGNVVRDGCRVSNSDIGYGTYIGKNSCIESVKIGKYCSIAENVTVVQGKHPSREWVTTCPAFFSTSCQNGFSYVSRQKYNEFSYADGDSMTSVIIGNDVWIGYGATILEGVTIADGAIIGARAMVTKNVPPYAVVCGNPGKILRYRFKDDEIAWLLNFKWWDKEEDWIKSHANLFESIDKLKNALK